MAIKLKYNTRLYTGTAAEFGASAKVWEKNAILLTTDSNLLKIGDGEHPYATLTVLNASGAIDVSNYPQLIQKTATAWGSDTTKYLKGAILVASDTGEVRVVPALNKKWSESFVIAPLPADVVKFVIKTATEWGSDVTEYKKGVALIASDTGEVRVPAVDDKAWADAVVLSPIPANVARVVKSTEPTDVLGANVFAWVGGKLYIGDGETLFSALEPIVDTTAGG